MVRRRRHPRGIFLLAVYFLFGSGMAALSCRADSPPAPKGGARFVDTCDHADLSLPLKELPPVRGDTARKLRPPHTDPPSTGPRKGGLHAHESFPGVDFSFLRRHELKTVRGVMVDGSRDCGEIRGGIERNLTPMRYAYNKALRRVPGLVGNVGFRFVVESSGRVSDCRVVEATMKNTDLQETLVKQILQWKFEPIAGNAGPTTVAFRFWCGA
jgi:TonB family protein